MNSEEIHLRLLREVPELGPYFGTELVLGNFGQIAWEQYFVGQQDIARRAFEYVEWTLVHAPYDLASRALSAVFKGRDWGPEAAAWVGPRTRTELAARDWAPRQLLG